MEYARYTADPKRYYEWMKQRSKNQKRKVQYIVPQGLDKLIEGYE